MRIETRVFKTRRLGDTEMTNIRSFRELKVWKQAMDLAMEIFEITKRFPKEEKYCINGNAVHLSRSS